MRILRPFPQEPVLGIEELFRLANMADNAGQVFLGLLVLTPLVTGIDKNNWFVVILGGLLTFTSWLFSIWFTQKAGKL